jgi:hypothetical protein
MKKHLEHLIRRGLVILREGVYRKSGAREDRGRQAAV